MTDKEIISQGYNLLAEDCSSKLDTPSASQIIIDGIDVSGCSSLEIDCGEFYCNENHRNVYCNSNRSCYYKQLQEKEQECEEYKAQAKKYLADYFEENKKCEELKERLKCKCFSPSSKQVRCNSYLRIAEDYKVDLAELNRIKIENKKLKEELKDCQQNALNRYIENNIQYVLASNCMFVSRYKQALEKIEEIAKKSNNPPCLEFDCDCSKCEDETTDNGATCMQYGLEKFLDIINEVKGDSATCDM